MTAQMKELRISDYRAGMDLREGSFLDDSKVRYKLLQNTRIGRDRRLYRRPPVRKLDLTIGNAYQGGFSADGRLSLIAEAGTGGGGLSGTDASMADVYEFDLPPGAVSGADNWELVDYVVLNDVLVAAIRHVVAGGTFATSGKTVDNLVYLHVWDDLYDDGRFRSWVSDPWVPGSFKRSLYYGNDSGSDDSRNEYIRDYRPVLAVAGNAVLMTTAGGDVARSKLGEPRFWNDRTQLDLQTSGDQFAFFKDTDVASVIPTPFKFEDLVWIDNGTGNDPVFRNDDEGHDGYRFWSYTLQFWHPPTEAWIPFSENVTGTTVGSMGAQRFKLEEDSDGFAEIVINDPTNDLDRLILRFKAIRDVHQEVPIADIEIKAGAEHFAVPNWAAGAVALWNQSAVLQGGSPANDYLEWQVPDDNNTYLAGVTDHDWDLPFETSTGQLQGTVQTTASASGSVYVSTTTAGSGSGDLLLRPAGQYYATGTARYAAVWWAAVFRDDGVGGRTLWTNLSRPDQGWHDDRFLLESRIAGSTSAGVIGTSIYDDGGGQVLSIEIVRNSALIQYETTSSLWYLPPDINQIAHLGTHAIGCGDNGHPMSVRFDGGLVMAPTATGFRAWTASGDDLLALADKNLGEAIDDAPQFNMQAAAFWPWFGQYIAAGKEEGSPDFVCWVLDFSTESRIAGWSRWTFSADIAPLWRSAALTMNGPGFQSARGAIYHDQDRLYWRHDASIYYLDGSEDADFRDQAEIDAGDPPVAEVIESHRMRPHERQLKALRYVETDMDGTAQLDIAVSMADTSEYLTGPEITGTTYDHPRIRWPVEWYSLGWRLTSTDQAGLTLREIQFLYLPQGKWRG